MVKYKIKYLLITILILCYGCSNEDNKSPQEYIVMINDLEYSGKIDSAIIVADNATQIYNTGFAYGALQLAKGLLYLRPLTFSSRDEYKGIELLKGALPFLEDSSRYYTGGLSNLVYYSIRLQDIDTLLIEYTRKAIKDSLLYTDYLGYYFLAEIQFALKWPRDSTIRNIDTAIELAGEGHPVLEDKRKEYIEYYEAIAR